MSLLATSENFLLSERGLDAGVSEFFSDASVGICSFDGAGDFDTITFFSFAWSINLGDVAGRFLRLSMLVESFLGESFLVVVGAVGFLGPMFRLSHEKKKKKEKKKFFNLILI